MAQFGKKQSNVVHLKTWPKTKGKPIYLAVPVWVALATGIIVVQPDFSNHGASTGSFALCGQGRKTDCIVDGDTLRKGTMKIRLLDIDTPEIHDYKCASELQLGLQAKYRLLELVNAGPFEIRSAGDRDVDQYGRKLRRLERNGVSLGQTLVDEGLARPYNGYRRPWCS